MRLKHLIIPLLLFKAFFSIAQPYTPVISSGKQFSVNWDCSPCFTLHGGSQYYFDGDTTINNTQYEKLMGLTAGVAPQLPNYDTLYLAALLREDTVNKKLYKFYGLPQDSIDTLRFGSEHVLYDFNAQVGDTITEFTSQFPGYRKHVISNIAYKSLLNGDSVREFQSDQSTLYTEGIINSNIAIDLFMTGFTQQVRCVYAEYALLLYTGFPDFCHRWRYIGQHETAVDQKQIIDIYPNPAHTAFTFEGRKAQGILKLFTLQGTMVLMKKIRGPKQTIAVSHLKPGFYFWRYKQQGAVAVGKLKIVGN